MVTCLTGSQRTSRVSQCLQSGLKIVSICKRKISVYRFYQFHLRRVSTCSTISDVTNAVTEPDTQVTVDLFYPMFRCSRVDSSGPGTQSGPTSTSTQRNWSCCCRFTPITWWAGGDTLPVNNNNNNNNVEKSLTAASGPLMLPGNRAVEKPVGEAWLRPAKRQRGQEVPDAGLQDPVQHQIW